MELFLLAFNQSFTLVGKIPLPGRELAPVGVRKTGRVPIRCGERCLLKRMFDPPCETAPL